MYFGVHQRIQIQRSDASLSHKLASSRSPELPKYILTWSSICNKISSSNLASSSSLTVQVSQRTLIWLDYRHFLQRTSFIMLTFSYASTTYIFLFTFKNPINKWENYRQSQSGRLSSSLFSFCVIFDQDHLRSKCRENLYIILLCSEIFSIRRGFFSKINSQTSCTLKIRSACHVTHQSVYGWTIMCESQYKSCARTNEWVIKSIFKGLW